MPECHRIWALAMFALLAFSSPLLAVDGVIEINQARALAGGVTPGDTPGFPVTISEAGSYRLTGSLAVPDANTDGIVVTVSTVTIDLNGFAIAGDVTCSGSPVSCSSTGSGNGIKAIAGASLVTVTNGTIRGMGKAGLFLSGQNVVDRVSVLSNGLFGMSIGNQSAVTRSLVTQNGGSGIVGANVSVVTNNIVFLNVGDGLNANSGWTVSGNTFFANGGDGVRSTNSTVVGNTVTSNAGYGVNFLGTAGGYANNVVNGNNGGDANPQVSGGIPMGTNVCGGDTACP